LTFCVDQMVAAGTEQSFSPSEMFVFPFTINRFSHYEFDDAVYYVSKGTSHTFGVYDRSFRMMNVCNSTQTFGKARVLNVRQVANQLILIFYDFSPINTRPTLRFILCIPPMELVLP
jgi:hypothetical protein